MHIAVLTSPNNWYWQDLQRAAADRHCLEPSSFSQLVAAVGLSDDWTVSINGRQATEFDAVLVRSMPPGSLEQIIFRMDALHRIQRSGTMVVNPPRSLEVAIDKYLALAKIADAGLLIPPTITCQSKEAAMDAFDRLGGDVVVKPLFGGEGRGIARLTDEALAHRAFQMLEELGAVIYVQQFIHHLGQDLRVLLLGDHALAITRHNPHDWRTNISRGAKPRPAQLSARFEQIARRAAQAVAAPLAGVDILVGKDQQAYVLEVNAVPGWHAVSRTLNVDVAAMMLRWLEAQRSR